MNLHWRLCVLEQNGSMQVLFIINVIVIVIIIIIRTSFLFV